MNSYESLLSRIRMVRRRWRMQKLVKGVALFLIAAIALLILGIWGANLFGFKSGAVWAMRFVTAGATVYVALHFFVAPFRRRISDIQIAQYIEERYPDLEDRLVTAVEFGEGKGIAPGMLDLLIKDAMEKTSRIDFSVFVNRKRLTVYGGAGVLTFLILIALLNWGPPFFQYGFDRLYVQWADAAPRTPFFIEVTPGDVEIAKGLDQQIKAQLIGFDSANVRLFTQPANSSAWTPAAMEPEPYGNGFLYLLVEVKSDTRYYVTSGDVRSKTFTIKVNNAPRVDKIDLTYKFPAYTGMPEQTVEGEGDISAIKGTHVELRIHASESTQSARLLFDDQTTLPLASSGDQNFSGALTLKRSGSYVVQFADASRHSYAASPEYEMEALPDAPPKVTITKPMRDARATSVEEVYTEVKAEDDIGVSHVQLHYSVNGDPEKVVVLYDGKPGEKTVVSPYTFLLEDFSLQPGDLISYYAKATDNNNATGPGIGASDIYFIHIRPFDQRYIQSQQRGGTDNSGGAPRQQEMSLHEKDIISATYKLIRDKDTMDPKKYADDLKALALAQSKLQAQNQEIFDRLSRRGALQVNKDWSKLGEYMKGADDAMGKAAVLLGAEKPTDALPEEQRALQQLMRAEAMFNEIQVSFENQRGQGGQHSQASAEDLADLFDLEMNKLKNQYETVQRGEQQARDQQVDEAMERLKELAQRQQQLNERNQMTGRPPGSSVASGGGAQGQQQLNQGNQAQGARGSSASSNGNSAQAQQQLLNDAENLQRQLQRLSRERSSPELNQASNQLQQAIQQMRQSLQDQQRNGQETSAQGIRALQQLQQAQRALSRGQQTDLNQGLQRAVEESRAVLNEENRIRSGVEKLTQDRQNGAAQEALQQQRESLGERKDVLADRVQNLQGQIEDLQQQARKTQPQVNNKLGQAASTIRDSRLPERIRDGSQPQMGLENFIQDRLQEVNKQLEASQSALGQTQEGKLEDALNRTRQLAEGLQSMQQRLQSSLGQQGQQGQGEQRGQQARGGDPNQRISAGGPPQGDVSGAMGDARPPGGGSYNAGDPRQQQSELQQRLTDARNLGRLLDRNSTPAQNMDQVLQQLQRMTDSRRYNSAEGIASLRLAIDKLHQVELDLARDLQRSLQNDKFFYADDSEVPASYKKLVDEYYKALAKAKK